jgi:hypothetical protein
MVEAAPRDGRLFLYILVSRMVLILRCANGVVAWQAYSDEKGKGKIRCITDGTVIPMSLSFDATWPTALASVLQHSVTLQGAFQQLWVLPSRFS